MMQVTGWFLESPKVGDTVIRANIAPAIARQYRVQKINAKSVVLSDSDNQIRVVLSEESRTGYTVI